ncbi:MAG: hypothetical protein E6K94_09605 [Thaumarchaeota archaeon]|nr:MAG: hypothetical protein E6K94_09605 [Nitrososphaerota archaeon]
MNSASYCKFCGMAFINEPQLERHFDLIHVRSLFQCQSCNKIFKDETEFKQHTRIHFRLLNVYVSH